MITPRNLRHETLVLAGVPAAFLNALDHLAEYGDLQFIASKPDAAYFYLPQISDVYSTLQGQTITPIFDGTNGNTFYVHLSGKSGNRFVFFELENDEIYQDFGADFQFMLAHLLIEFYEFSESATDDLVGVGQALGFRQARSLFEALEQADEIRARKTFELDSAWRRVHIPRIVG